MANNELNLRPPGALAEQDFLKACLKCGLCVEACPYDSLKLSDIGENAGNGTPFFEPREVPCYMCPEIPCVPICPSGALNITKLNNVDEQPDIRTARMGLAVIHKETCIAFWGIQCDACYRACPLLDEAISLEYEKNERTGKHAFRKPVVNGEICTGCGICEHACVTEKPAIKVLPLNVVAGKVGDHYIKGWDKKDENRLKDVNENPDKPQDEKEVIDYLNDWENLIDD